MAVSLTIDRACVRHLAAAMALVMMIASLPAVGVIVVSDRSGPAIAMDICHPLQSLNVSTGAVTIARPAQPELCDRATIDSREALVQFVPIAPSALAEAPDPPPPKPLV